MLALVLGCGQSPPATAKATLVNSQGQKVGEATLTRDARRGEDCHAGGESAPGEHAFHIHEKGVCATRISRAPAATLIPSRSTTA